MTETERYEAEYVTPLWLVYKRHPAGVASYRRDVTAVRSAVRQHVQNYHAAKCRVEKAPERSLCVSKVSNSSERVEMGYRAAT